MLINLVRYDITVRLHHGLRPNAPLMWCVVAVALCGWNIIITRMASASLRQHQHRRMRLIVEDLYCTL